MILRSALRRTRSELVLTAVLVRVRLCPPYTGPQKSLRRKLGFPNLRRGTPQRSPDDEAEPYFSAVRGGWNVTVGVKTTAPPANLSAITPSAGSSEKVAATVVAGFCRNGPRLR